MIPNSKAIKTPVLNKTGVFTMSIDWHHRFQ